MGQPGARRKFPIELSGSWMPVDIRTRNSDAGKAQTYSRLYLAYRAGNSEYLWTDLPKKSSLNGVDSATPSARRVLFIVCESETI
jgi:hypothetical protein